MVALQLARSAEEWVGIFARYNSGTYNNQVRGCVAAQPGGVVRPHMLLCAAVDGAGQAGLPSWAGAARERAAVDPGAGAWCGVAVARRPALAVPAADVVCARAGMTRSADVTGVLKRQGYWASFNVPYLEEVRAAAPSPALPVWRLPAVCWLTGRACRSTTSAATLPSWLCMATPTLTQAALVRVWRAPRAACAWLGADSRCRLRRRTHLQPRLAGCDIAGGPAASAAVRAARRARERECAADA